MSEGDGNLTPVGQFVLLIGVVGILTGLYVGWGMSVHSIGVDSTSLADLGKAHVVNCGSAFAPEWQSVGCEQALSSRKIAAIVLLAGGAVVFLGSLIAFQKPKATPPSPQRQASDVTPEL